MTLDEAIKSLMALQAKLAAYGHAMGLLFYDGATTAPKGTAANRGQTMSILSEEHYKLTTGGETVALLEFLDAHKSELNEKQQRMVFLLIKDIRNMQKIPMDEYVAYQQLLVEADDVWHRAKETSDFALFEPVLEKIFETNIRFAHYCAPEKDPYDYWLSEYEDGLTMAQCDEFFATLREHIVPLLKKIKEKPQVDDAMLHGHFPEEKQAQLSDYLMRTMVLDLDHVGLSTTEHPFTTSLGSHFDERITTHYLEENFASSMFSVIHEGGHALYDTGSADDLAYTVLDGGVSMGIHESQSRFYENLLGRSRAFTGFVFPKLCELFPELSGHTAEEFYRAINKAEPSLIRTEADEVTYSLHVMVRYELEKRVMHGELKVHDLPGEWNRLYKGIPRRRRAGRQTRRATRQPLVGRQHRLLPVLRARQRLRRTAASQDERDGRCGRVPQDRQFCAHQCVEPRAHLAVRLPQKARRALGAGAWRKVRPDGLHAVP